MNEGFWHQKWREGQIGFHEGKPNDYLVRYAARLGASKRVLVPLCGKTEDLAYLARLGHQVVGCELVEDAVRAFFAEHALSPEVRRAGAHSVYSAGAITIVAGDFLATTRELLGATDAFYDRAALVALGLEVRPKYVAHVRSLVEKGAVGLLVSYVHDQGGGPPFSVPDDEVRRWFPSAECLEERPDPRGRPATEKCWSIASI